MTWKKRFRTESVKVVLSSEDAPCRSRCIVGVNQIFTKLR